MWQKEIDVNQSVDRFTVGKDRELDVLLARADVLGSLAHTRMLESIGLMSSEDLSSVQKELKEIFAEVERGEFSIEDGVEDVHSQVEFLLTERIGDAGKRIHSGRSRNDQVALDMRLYTREQVLEVIKEARDKAEAEGRIRRAQVLEGVLVANEPTENSPINVPRLRNFSTTTPTSFPVRL